MLEATALAYHQPRGFTLSTGALRLHPGRILGILGPNGAGKSTLLDLLSGAVTPHSGSVTWDGRTPRVLGRRRWARSVAMVAQDAGDPPPMLVGDYVSMGLIPQIGLFSRADHDGLEVITHAMRTAGVADLAQSRMSELSGGQRQRVRISRALAQSPRALLLDEPTNHLDVAAINELIALLSRLASEGIAVAVTLHDIDLAAYIADDVMIMDQGRTVDIGPTDTTLTPSIIRRCWKVDVQPVHAHRRRRFLVDYSTLPRQLARQLEWTALGPWSSLDFEESQVGEEVRQSVEIRR